MRRTCRHGNTGSEDLAKVINRRYLHNNAVTDPSRYLADASNPFRYNMLNGFAPYISILPDLHGSVQTLL